MSATIEAIRDFNRYYTRRIGVLEQNFLKSDLALPEGRVLFELAQEQGLTAVEIISRLDIDRGYLSRLLRNLEKRKLLTRKMDPSDGRKFLLQISAKGRDALEALNGRATEATAGMISSLSNVDQSQLIRSMTKIKSLLESHESSQQVVLRTHRVGDLGIVAARQGELYAAEFGWDMTYEALAAKILAEFVMRQDSERECSWIAECGGEVVGSVYLMREDDETARLRLLYVDPSMRGRGLGKRLVEECTACARRFGYKRIVLWTQSILTPARRIYADQGYTLIKSEGHFSFGKQLVGETWEVIL